MASILTAREPPWRPGATLASAPFSDSEIADPEIVEKCMLDLGLISCAFHLSMNLAVAGGFGNHSYNIKLLGD